MTDKEINKSESDEITFKIRPAGRHIATIGEDLIKDQYAAIIELVKNAYDADASKVTILLESDVPVYSKVTKYIKNKEKDDLEKNDKYRIKISIEDDGHGMSRDVVLNSWMVPSTDRKMKNRMSDNGARVMQGRKGVGRYSSGMLGEDLLLSTTDIDGNTTTLYLEWKTFNEAEFLDQVEILIETYHTGKPSGTLLTIDCGIKSELWDKNALQTLDKELKKLTSPIQGQKHNKNSITTDEFSIYIDLVNFYPDETMNSINKIEPFPVFDLYDYKISGTIEESGQGNLSYSNQRARNTVEESIKVDLGSNTNCGKIEFDIRVYDREPDAIDGLIKRGLKDKEGNYFGKHDARNLLNEYNGIGVYRNGFRLRPLGDPEYDWLELNKRRVQNPPMRIGSDQVIGYILIESEENSGLEEKSARDGLKDNKSYKRFRDIIQKDVLKNLEERRYAYRKKAGISRRIVKLESELERLFSYETLKTDIKNKLNKSGADKILVDEVLTLVGNAEKEKNKVADDVRQAVAIYQGQATLGKIINVIMHEGRRPLGFIKTKIKNFHIWSNKLKKEYHRETLDKIIETLDGLGSSAQMFTDLFQRLDPLAAKKRANKTDFKVVDVIRKSVEVFESELNRTGINLVIECAPDLTFYGWDTDLYIIITNLVDNSYYWLTNTNCAKLEIKITVKSEAGKLHYIDFIDSGPGIESSHIDADLIFEPEFSTKPEGTGLGLAISGEAAERNNLELKVLDYSEGAYFRIQVKGDY